MIVEESSEDTPITSTALYLWASTTSHARAQRTLPLPRVRVDDGLDRHHLLVVDPLSKNQGLQVLHLAHALRGRATGGLFDIRRTDSKDGYDVIH